MTQPLQRLVQVEMPYGKYKGTLIADLPGNQGLFTLFLADALRVKKAKC